MGVYCGSVCTMDCFILYFNYMPYQLKLHISNELRHAFSKGFGLGQLMGVLDG